MIRKLVAGGRIGEHRLHDVGAACHEPPGILMDPRGFESARQRSRARLLHAGHPDVMELVDGDADERSIALGDISPPHGGLPD
jgi:hypothetical protein